MIGWRGWYVVECDVVAVVIVVDVVVVLERLVLASLVIVDVNCVMLTVLP